VSDAIRQITTTLAAVAAGRDVTKLEIQNEAVVARRTSPDLPRARRHRRMREQTRGHQRLDAISDPDAPQPAAAQHEHHDVETGGQSIHLVDDPSHPSSTTTTNRFTSPAAERPKSLDLRRTSSRPRSPSADEPKVVPTTSGVAEVGIARRLGPGSGDQKESGTTQHGRCRLKVSDIPGSEPHAEHVNRGTYDSDTGHSQTPDSGVAISPLDQHSAAVQPPDVVVQVSPTGPEYRIAQTPNKSTIVIINSPSRQPGRTTTPTTSSPVSDQTPVTFPPSVVQPVVVQPVTGTGPTISRQPGKVSAATSKFVVPDATTTAAARRATDGVSPVSFPSTTNDERTVLRLNSGDSDRRRYVVTAGTLTTVVPSAANPPPPSDTPTSVPIERESIAVTNTFPSRLQNEVEFGVGSRQAVIPQPVAPAQTQPPAERIATPHKPKPLAPVTKQRDAKSTAVAKQRQLTAQKRVPANGKGQSGQRSKQSQISKQSAKGLHSPVKSTQSGSKRRDSGSEQTSVDDALPVKLSVAQLRAKFQAPSS